MAASEQPYQMSFTSGGMQLNACVDLAKIRLELGSWDQAARSAVSTGLTGLPKASSNERTVRELVKRLKTLNDRELEFLLHEAHRSDQIQLLWISICRAYRFVREFASDYLNSAQTKGSVSTTVLVNTKLKRQLEKFAKQYPVHMSTRTAPLLFSAKGGGFSAQTIVNLFKRIYKIAGIEGASSHSGRRQFVTKLADQGINARLVQVLARHKHLSTTQRYIDVNENALRNAVELLK